MPGHERPHGRHRQGPSLEVSEPAATRVAVIAESRVHGGAERYLHRLWSTPGPGGVEATLYGHVPGWAEAGLPQVEVPFGPKWGRRTIVRGLLRAPRERHLVGTALRRDAPHVAHMQFKREQLALTGPVSSLVPVVWTEHGPLPGGHLGQALSRAYRTAARKVELIVCVSDIVAESVSRVVAPTTRLEVLPNAIDTRLFTPSGQQDRRQEKQAWGLDPDAPLVLWLGRFDEGKLPELAVSAMVASGMQFLMCGDGPLGARVRHLAEASAVGRVLPFHPEPHRLLAAADVLLFTSDGRGEGFPTVLLEASASAVPVVMNASSGFGHVADATAGLGVEADARALADALGHVVGEPAHLRTARRSWAEQFDVRVLRERYDGLLREIVG